jgi:hypothetical protein
MFRTLVCLGCFSMLALVGCDSNPKEKEIKIQVDATGEAKAILKRYAAGSKPGSEVTGFKNVVAEVRKVDAAKADILEKGLDEIEKNPANAKTKATELLKQLGWS